MRGNVTLENDYAVALRKLTREMAQAVTREVTHVMQSQEANEFFAQDSIVEDVATILDTITRRFEKRFGERAEPTAEKYIGRADKASTTKVKTSILSEIGERFTMAAIEPTGKVGQILKAQIAESVDLIKSIPAQYLEKVRGAVMRSITTGNGLQTLVPALAKLNGESMRRARNIAKDQTRKAYNNLNKARVEAAGVKAFEWIHSGGANEPRPLHLNTLDGKIFRFDDLPVIDENTGERGIPGQLPNCGCTMRPVFIFDDENEG